MVRLSSCWKGLSHFSHIYIRKHKGLYWKVVPGHSRDFPGRMLCHQRLDAAEVVLITLSHFLPVSLTGASICNSASTEFDFIHILSFYLCQWEDARCHLCVREKSWDAVSWLICRFHFSLRTRSRHCGSQDKSLEFQKVAVGAQIGRPEAILSTLSKLVRWCDHTPCLPLCAVRAKSLLRDTKSTTSYLHAWNRVGTGDRK